MMSCITPFLTDYIYQNLKNGINPAQKEYFAESIHFLSIPEYKESLLNEKIEVMISRMQSVIEIGRNIRNTKNLSIKTPLSRVIIVQSDKQAIDDLKTLQTYIKEELNCLDFEIKENEEEFVIYNTQPDHKEIGSVLKNLYSKTLKEKLGNLTRDEIVTYLRDGKIKVGEVEILEGWLKISKQFNDKY
jgi:isoleucyl-tRNA synthetase